MKKLLIVAITLLALSGCGKHCPNEVVNQDKTVELQIGDVFYLNDPKYNILEELTRYKVLDTNLKGVFCKDVDNPYTSFKF